MSLPIIRHIALMGVIGSAWVSGQAQTAIVIHPLEYVALQAGHKAINDEVSKQTATQLATAGIEATITAEFAKMKQWEKEYADYLKQTSGFASSLKATTTLFHDGVRIFMTLGQLKKAITDNPQGIVATMSMNNIYMETASELVSVLTLFNTAIAEGGEQNMLTGAERCQTLWAISDKVHQFHRKLNKLMMSIKYYTINDVWSSATAGMTEPDIGKIVKDSHSRWKRIATSIK